MLWIVLLLIILLLVGILLLPLEFKIDTRVPVIMMRWKAIGSAALLFENEEWWLKIQVLFFSKKWNLIQLFFAGKKKLARIKNRRKKNARKNKTVFRILKVLKTFRIVQWEIAFSAEDNVKNAYWYWLNFFPLTRRHIHVNFIDENYLVLVIKNKIGRVVYAFIK